MLSGAIEHTPIIIDSTIYSIDCTSREVVQLALHENITSSVTEEFLYALTPHHLYKIDTKNLVIVDNIPLPFRFIDIGILHDEIILVSMNEIVSLDKKRLSFKGGIGIERGDYRQIIPPQAMNSPSNQPCMYLVTDIGEKSIIKMLNITTGAVIRELHVPKILAYTIDTASQTMTTLDSENTLRSYDFQLTRQATIRLPVPARSFIQCRDGYIVYTQTGLFFIDTIGSVIDFQPIPFDEQCQGDNYTFLLDGAIVRVDSLTLRVKEVSRINRNTKRLLYSRSNNRIIVVDAENDFYILDDGSLGMRCTVTPATYLERITSPPLGLDSLWYIQLGAFIYHDNAATLCDSIARLNIPAFVDSTDLYRVKVGGFKDKTAAAEFIMRAGFNGWLVFQEKFDMTKPTVFYIDSQKFIAEDGIIRKE
jgi:hypothetical protein